MLVALAYLKWGGGETRHPDPGHLKKKGKRSRFALLDEWARKLGLGSPFSAPVVKRSRSTFPEGSGLSLKAEEDEPVLLIKKETDFEEKPSTLPDTLLRHVAILDGISPALPGHASLDIAKRRAVQLLRRQEAEDPFHEAAFARHKAEKKLPGDPPGFMTIWRPANAQELEAWLAMDAVARGFEIERGRYHIDTTGERDVVQVPRERKAVWKQADGSVSPIPPTVTTSGEPERDPPGGNSPGVYINDGLEDPEKFDDALRLNADESLAAKLEDGAFIIDDPLKRRFEIMADDPGAVPVYSFYPDGHGEGRLGLAPPLLESALAVIATIVSSGHAADLFADGSLRARRIEARFPDRHEEQMLTDQPLPGSQASKSDELSLSDDGGFKPGEGPSVDIEEGFACPVEGCDGEIEFSLTENCSCHISSPCASCLAVYLFCPVCQWSELDEDEAQDTGRDEGEN